MDSPALEMCDQQSLTEPYLMSSLLYTVDKFNIFNRGTWIGFIEAAHSMKDFRPNRSTGAPKGRGFFLRCLMRIVMEQIFVLREEIRLRRLVIIRAYHCGHIRIVL